MAVKMAYIYTCDKKGCGYRTEGPEFTDKINIVSVHAPGKIVSKTIQLCPRCYNDFSNWAINENETLESMFGHTIIPASGPRVTPQQLEGIKEAFGPTGGHECPCATRELPDVTVTVSGHPASGKSWLAYKLIKQLEKAGAVILYGSEEAANGVVAKRHNLPIESHEESFKSIFKGKYILFKEEQTPRISRESKEPKTGPLKVGDKVTLQGVVSSYEGSVPVGVKVYGHYGNPEIQVHCDYLERTPETKRAIWLDLPGVLDVETEEQRKAREANLTEAQKEAIKRELETWQGEKKEPPKSADPANPKPTEY